MRNFNKLVAGVIMSASIMTNLFAMEEQMQIQEQKQQPKCSILNIISSKNLGPSILKYFTSKDIMKFRLINSYFDKAVKRFLNGSYKDSELSCFINEQNNKMNLIKKQLEELKLAIEQKEKLLNLKKADFLSVKPLHEDECEQLLNQHIANLKRFGLNPEGIEERLFADKQLETLNDKLLKDEKVAEENWRDSIKIREITEKFAPYKNARDLFIPDVINETVEPGVILGGKYSRLLVLFKRKLGQLTVGSSFNHNERPDEQAKILQQIIPFAKNTKFDDLFEADIWYLNQIQDQIKNPVHIKHMELTTEYWQHGCKESKRTVFPCAEVEKRYGFLHNPQISVGSITYHVETECEGFDHEQSVHLYEGCSCNALLLSILKKKQIPNLRIRAWSNIFPKEPINKDPINLNKIVLDDNRGQVGANELMTFLAKNGVKAKELKARKLFYDYKEKTPVEDVFKYMIDIVKSGVSEKIKFPSNFHLYGDNIFPYGVNEQALFNELFVALQKSSTQLILTDNYNIENLMKHLKHMEEDSYWYSKEQCTSFKQFIEGYEPLVAKGIISFENKHKYYDK